MRVIEFIKFINLRLRLRLLRELVYFDQVHYINVPMKRIIYILFFLPFCLHSQKEIYIPQEWLQGSLDYSLDRSAQSDNFIVFWGPLAGTDPTQASPDIAFDPQQILNTSEDLYRFYIDTIRFVDDDSGLISQYKIILVMLHTWPGLEGWAFGGNYDGIVGAMWMHPHAASSGPTLAHEFTHTLQNYTWMMNPGHGFIDSSYVGFFWETHAEFMALQRYPSVALEFDMARWFNTSQFHWSSTRHHYQAFIFLQFIKERDGITMINRLWNESIIGEHPLETYKRLKGITQDDLNFMFGEYAMRNVTWDYEIGNLLQERVSTLDSVFVSHFTIIPEVIDTSRGWYQIQNHLAPQDYGYNIIRLYPDSASGDCDQRTVYLNFKNQRIWPDYEEAGLLYGFVTVNNLGEPRYGELYTDDKEVIFQMMNDETELYLVVIGAPVNHHNYAWEIGFPKIYRYPYEFRIVNAKPEGYQPGFRKIPEGVAGAFHPNGGGFVASTADVEPSVYVGPHAMVLDGARVWDDARIEDYAIIRLAAVIYDSAVISDQAVIGGTTIINGNARVNGQAHVDGASEVFGNALITDNAQVFFTRVFENAQLIDNTFAWGATLHGDVLLGGDAEFFSECDNGTYMQFESAYNRNCDGLDDHHANIDITERFFTLSHDGDVTLVCDSLVENYFYEEDQLICEGDTFYFYGDTLTSPGLYEKIFEASNGADSIISLWLHFYNTPILTGHIKICEGDTIILFGDPYFDEGLFPVDTIDENGCLLEGSIRIEWYDVDTTVERLGNSLVALATASTFQWYDCITGLPVPGANQRTFNPASNGTFKVEVTDIHGCNAFSECYDAIIVATHETDNYHFNILPNPANEYIQVSLEPPLQKLSIEIFDVLGQLQIRQSFTSGISEKIDVKELSPGMYLFKLSDDKGIFSVKLFTKI